MLTDVRVEFSAIYLDIFLVQGEGGGVERGRGGERGSGGKGLLMKGFVHQNPV